MTQTESWQEWLRTHNGTEDHAMAYYSIPCPRCKAREGWYCNGTDGHTGSDTLLCEIRKKVWEAMGKPSTYNEAKELMNGLVWKMAEAAHD